MSLAHNLQERKSRKPSSQPARIEISPAHNLLWSTQWKSCVYIVKWCSLYLCQVAIAREIPD